MSIVPSIEPSASRSTSRRRAVRSAREPASSSHSCRATVARCSCSSTSAGRGRSSSSFSSHAAASGMRSKRFATKREPESTWVSRSAPLVESRSIRRYQGSSPSSSEIRRKASSPPSGSAP